MTYITKYIILSKALRNPHSSWSYTKTKLLHSGCGGVTDGRWWVLVCSYGHSFTLNIPEQAQRDANTIVDCLVNHGRPCTANHKILQSTKPEVVYLRPGTVHVSGLLPWDPKLTGLSLRTFSVSPSGAVVSSQSQNCY